MTLRSTAPTVRRRGRPLRLPEDSYPLHTHLVGCDQRIAWLLTVTRVLGPRPEFAKRDAFVRELKERGHAVDSSRISRWESGLQPVPTRVAATYEGLLGLTEGSLVAVAHGLRRSFSPGALPKETVVRDHEASEAEFDELVDLALSGGATGAQWLRLVDHLNHFDRVFLRSCDWTALCQRLVNELGTAVGSSYVRRYEAASGLVLHPSARRHLLLAVGKFVTHPDVQVVAPVLNLLAEVPDPAAAALTLRMLTAENGHKHLRRGASSVAAVKLVRGHFDADALPHLEGYVLRAMHKGEFLDGRLDAFDLAVQLPEESWHRVRAHLGTRRSAQLVTQARATGELVTPHQAAALVAELAPAVQTETAGNRQQEPDLMLRRLLREALLHVHKPRRHHAALLIGASPYAAAAARHCLELATQAEDLIAARAWAALMRLGPHDHRERVVKQALEDRRPTIRSRALVNLGLTGEVRHDEAKAMVAHLDGARSSERHGILFALGMGGSRTLEGLAEEADPAVQRPARWWLNQGPAIRDADTLGAVSGRGGEPPVSDTNLPLGR